MVSHWSVKVEIEISSMKLEIIVFLDNVLMQIYSELKLNLSKYIKYNIK